MEPPDGRVAKAGDNGSESAPASDVSDSEFHFDVLELRWVD